MGKIENSNIMTEANQLNRLRAAVLGANDGIVSVSSIVMGVAGATGDTKTITLAGVAALVAGALSMAVGEYVSVSSQSDAEKAQIEETKRRLKDTPAEEAAILTDKYRELGLTKMTARSAVGNLPMVRLLGTHLRVRYNLDPDDINNPWHAAFSSLWAFLAGGAVPILAILLAGDSLRIPVTVVAVLVGLVFIGVLSARASGTHRVRAAGRVVLGGVIAMVVTYGVGALFGTAIS